MKTVTVKTADLEGAALDWAVGVAQGWVLDEEYDDWLFHGASMVGRNIWRPSDDWGQGGPLLDKYDIALNGAYIDDHRSTNRRIIFATLRNVPKESPFSTSQGETRLIAAMRSIVAAEIGDTVEIPRELTQ